MPSFCVVPDCQDKYKTENISFHKFTSRFPHKRKDLLKKWIEFANREPGWKPSKWSAICCRHFAPEDFVHFNCRKKLKKTAVPSIKASWNDPTDLRPSTDNTQQEDLKVAESSCRLCGICSRPVATFATNFEIFGMIQKCLPTLNIQLDDNLPKDMCSSCLKSLNNFSEFVDTVLETQKLLQNTIRSEKFIKPPERQLKIKQEPVVNVKQEVAEHFDSFLSDELEEDQDCEQKFSFCDFPMLNTQDIINNCDIMEIINLDDPFIDIPDDENCSEMDQIVNTDFFIPKTHCPSKIEHAPILHDHNYAMPIDSKESINFPNVYKTEKTEDKEDMLAGSVPPDTLITAKPKYPNEPTILRSDLNFNDNSSSRGKLEVTSVSDLLPRPTVETSVRKPNIVVLNESIVKTASAFHLHPCSMCQSQFFSAEGLKHHVTNTHVPMVTLPIKSISEPTDLETQLKSIQCGHCSISFLRIRDLLKHKIKMHPKAIRRKNEGRECTACEKFFMSRIALRNHINYICLTKNTKSSNNTIECRFCSKKNFSHWRIFRNHESECKLKAAKKRNKNKNTSKKPEQIRKTKTKPSSSNLFNLLCLGCKKKFNTIDHFRLHYVENQCQIKPTADEVLAFCTTCCKPITKFSRTRTHRHFQKAKYFCKECPKIFKTLKLLVQHRITHSDIRKHKCKLCEKSFKRTCGLQQHIKAKHLKLKPHECIVCKRLFALKADMLRCKHSILTN